MSSAAAAAMRKANLRKHIDSHPGNLVDVESDIGQARQAYPESTDLAELVFKHFEDEIRETLIEVQESLADRDWNQHLGNRKENERVPYPWQKFIFS
jgi:hypothetical protein